MGLAARRERERFEVREKILDAARKLLAENGQDGISMRKIAAEIEYSPTVIYSHFSDKQTLMRALVDEDYVNLSCRIKKHKEEDNPVKRLRLIAQDIISFALENPNHYLLLTKTSMTNTKMEVVHDESSEDAKDIVLETIHEAIQQGHLRSVLHDAEMLTQTFFAGIHGVIAIGIGDNTRIRINWRSIEERLNLMIDLLISGLTENHQIT